MDVLIILLNILMVAVIFLWLRMAVFCYNLRGVQGILIFLSHCFTAFFVVLIIWIIIISPVMFFEEEQGYPITETILFFSIIIVLMGAWALLVTKFLKARRLESNSLEQTNR